MSKRLLAIVFFTPIIIALVINFLFFSPVDPKADTQIFIVDADSSRAQIVDNLLGQGYIKKIWPLKFTLSLKAGQNQTQLGGYYLSKSQTVWQIANKLKSPPDLIWIAFSEGLRKEQIGEILAQNLNWPEDELEKWNTIYTATSPEYTEGVYFPDTYLIPVNETGDLIAQRMIRNFNDKLNPYLEELAKQNIKWTTAIKLASIIQREAGGSHDMPLVAGILWNRLLIDMKLDIDATVQYARGQTASGWWTPISGDQTRSIDSPYNTYKYKGRPPTPICNPGLRTIKAVLYPEESDYLFYLHDTSGQIHTAKTYQEHLDNIDEFL